ncbi:chromatin modification-related protein MEAF6 isoform X1 [Pistacia vera]|uniref:chromatin modification-related protein MEAF6 isoform X1 n=2 Tax=Pistacia vera TaxID=55513 RepID=UPI001263B205|nr:chromatin modification-related protein MEAF6 isoform X1 [Pistacia vera]
MDSNEKMFLGQRGNSNPASVLAALMSKRERFQEELRNIEKQVYDLETRYLQDSGQYGTALKGFEGFLSSSKNTTNLKRSRKLQPEDRIFSLSSVTSPAAEELGVGRDDGRSDYGPGRSKAGSLPSNGQGKPKKGRAASAVRDGKRNRALSEADFDDEDDPDMSLR